ncbi:hypothetical protein AnigIFM63604_011137 [Aspergillus niger]|uniref:Uncharacterized protein n=1 Tax=Aspergillus niger TaxID=5061 RepID=A0A9W6A4U7_ASPNG|nr:hypothetical protein AnigIFM63604_011137 [Aspergillus niger]
MSGFNAISPRRPDLRSHHILLDADEFVTKYDIDDLRDEIRTGALLVDDPDHIGCFECLADEETRALALERQPIPEAFFGALRNSCLNSCCLTWILQTQNLEQK